MYISSVICIFAMKSKRNGMDLSIIVPVYNVEKYVRACIESIYRQGIDENRFEVIIVNDGTQDHSMEVIADIIEQHPNISIINQDNLSLSVARNNGIAKAKGLYILMPDSDDLLIDNSLAVLLDKAIETEADIVVANYLRINEEGHIIDSPPIHEETEIEFKEMNGDELLLNLDPNQCHVWRRLYKRSFIIDNQISFVPKINFQDVPFMHECYLKAQKGLLTQHYLYLYRFNRSGAATASFSLEKARSLCTAIAKTWELRKIRDLSPKIMHKMEEDVYITFSLLIYRTLFSITKISGRNQVIDMINEYVPDLRFTHGFRQKLTTFMLKKMPHFYINFYYYYSLVAYK